MKSESPRIFVAGCGYVGQKLATLLNEAGHPVTGITHTVDSAERLSKENPWDAIALDITNGEAVYGELGGNQPAPWIVHCASSGRGGGPEQYEAVYLRGIENLIALNPERVLFTSSTSVYPQTDGSLIDEEAWADPMRKTGAILRKAERATLDYGGTVVRLAGIYGPGRSVLLQRFLKGESQIDIASEPVDTPDGRWINQIHRDDAAAAIAFLLLQPDWNPIGGQIFNACDSQPMNQRMIYTELAERFNKPMPPGHPPDKNRKRGWSNKRILNQKLINAGWLPTYHSYFNALEDDPELVPSILAKVKGS